MSKKFKILKNILLKYYKIIKNIIFMQNNFFFLLNYINHIIQLYKSNFHFSFKHYINYQI